MLIRLSDRSKLSTSEICLISYVFLKRNLQGCYTDLLPLRVELTSEVLEMSAENWHNHHFCAFF